MGRDSTQTWQDGRVEPWFDTHVHLGHFDTAPREGILERAATAGVAVIDVGVDLESSAGAVTRRGTSPAIAGAVVGVHPRQAERWDAGELRRLAGRPGVVGVGECGFDGGEPNWATQEAVFRAQCEIARELGLALVVHIDGEGAWERLTANEDAVAGLRVVRHYFTGDAGQAAWHAERGHYLSFGKPLLRDAALQAVAAGHTAELLLAETDSYPLPGRTTEPADVVKVGEALAQARGWTAGEARELLAANTRAAFALGED